MVPRGPMVRWKNRCILILRSMVLWLVRWRRLGGVWCAQSSSPRPRRTLWCSTLEDIYFV